MLWIPTLGPVLAGRTARAVFAPPPPPTPSPGAGGRSVAPPTAAASVLSGRLDNLALVRAAGYASGLTPEAAVIAYGASAVMAAAMGGVAVLARRVAERRISTSSSSSFGRGGNRPGDPAAEGTSLESEQKTTTASSRSELVVRRYLLGELQAAASKRHRKAWRDAAQAVVTLKNARPEVPPLATQGDPEALVPIRSDALVGRPAAPPRFTMRGIADRAFKLRVAGAAGVNLSGPPVM